MKFIQRLLLLTILLPYIAGAQPKDKPKDNWQNLDLIQDGVFGVSTEKAYNELLKGKKGKTVVVAVIDGGVDTQHEDLKSVMWTNAKETPGNKADDDKNGYVDDVHGWNFLGSPTYSVRYDNMEVVRLLRKYQDKYAAVLNTTPLSRDERKEFNLYKKMVTDYMGKLENARVGFENVSILRKSLDTIVTRIGKETPTLQDFDNYKTRGEIESKVIKIVKPELRKDPDYKKFREDIEDAYKSYYGQINYNLNMDFDPRDSIGDHYNNGAERFYGNSDVQGPDADHGTHVAGIIAADRHNNKGVKGVAENVKIMAVRAVPDGDERDKDVANAIRYAVDNGAKVINMSFGKSYSWDKALVDSAVRYAASKDVLLVHAAGNDSKNTDVENNFPTRIYADTLDANYWGSNQRMSVVSRGARPMGPGMSGMGSNASLKIERDTLKFTKPQAQNWIEVGASGWKNDDDLVAEFSNFGKRSVDVFAPGVKINSTIPGSKYKENDGTSMASPVVAGIAALVRSYYPSLTAVQVKDVIMKSVTMVEQKVKIREEGESKKVKLSDICISGGVVNAYNALKLAEQMQQRLSSK
ncbi:S8 family peptidase [Pararcticibacter amylolyticus]|uniref:Peptidase S8 n=1 Tax=Pararcticibacter amylolyticus TaxID=2173175 RepID=A0A2U2PER6_9SPHI|nr:S8 family peptidase [Pararcticibacter amylolyticus]PWG79876.1 peptidase S8 [Pararcticibacter amylolyticus]